MELAVKIGEKEAIVYRQLQFRMNGKSPDEWVWDTIEDWQKNHFPIWSIPTIRRTFSSLKKQGLIEAKRTRYNCLYRPLDFQIDQIDSSDTKTDQNETSDITQIDQIDTSEDKICQNGTSELGQIDQNDLSEVKKDQIGPSAHPDRSNFTPRLINLTPQIDQNDFQIDQIDHRNTKTPTKDSSKTPRVSLESNIENLSRDNEIPESSATENLSRPPTQFGEKEKKSQEPKERNHQEEIPLIEQASFVTKRKQHACKEADRVAAERRKHEREEIKRIEQEKLRFFANVRQIKHIGVNRREFSKQIGAVF